jgi:hypothetical protein
LHYKRKIGTRRVFSENFEKIVISDLKMRKRGERATIMGATCTM